MAGDNPKDCRLSIPDVHRIGKHVEDGEIVFDDNDRAFRGEFPYQSGCRDTLVDIQKRRNFVEEIEIGVSCKAGGDCHPLEFSTAQRADGVVEDCIEFERRNESFKLTPLISCFEQVAGRPGEHFRDKIDILGLDCDLLALF